MLKRVFSDTTTDVLTKALGGYAARQKAVANNIANVETPGYKRQRVNFEAQLREAVKNRTPAEARKAISELEIAPQIDPSAEAGPDGNSVNIDLEGSELAKAGMSYQLATTLMGLKLSMLKQAITEGRR